ncbi:MAG: hypothetical protein WD733_20095 [Bryobacterales bacterium]
MPEIAVRRARRKKPPCYCMLLLLSALWIAPRGVAQPVDAEKPETAFNAWPDAGFERAETRLARSTEIYPDGAPAYDYRLNLSLVFVEGTSWNQARVLRHVRKTANILGACGIALDRVRLVKARVPNELRRIDVSEPVLGSDIPRKVQRLSAMMPRTADWPVLFFIARIDGEDELARSYQRGDVPLDQLSRYPYMNTAWIAYKTHWIERAEDGYSTVAHELAHLLCECGHEGGSQRHLLHKFRNFLGAEVLPQHCQQFLRSPLLSRPSAVQLR